MSNEHPLVIRSRGRIVNALIWVVLAAFVLAVTLATNSSTWVGLVAAYLIVDGLANLRPRIEVDAQTVRIVNIFRSLTVPRSDVVSVDRGPLGSADPALVTQTERIKLAPLVWFSFWRVWRRPSQRTIGDLAAAL